MQAIMGLDALALGVKKRIPVTWDTQKLINGHTLIIGKSGTGKTHTLRGMLNQINSNAVRMGIKKFRVHIMDVHGDIDIPNCSTVKFSESTPYGFNPLSINPDPDFGGVRKRIQSFIATLSRTGYKLGTKQEAVLRNVLLDLYTANGFMEDDPSTWTLHSKNDSYRRYPKKYPSVDDAVRYSNAKLKGMFLGTNSKTVLALEKVYRKQNQFHNKLKQLGKQVSEDDIAQMSKELDNQKEEVCELFKEHLESLQNGGELTDLIRYDSKDVMKSVVDKLENLKNIGIFKAERPPFDPSLPIWRYDIKALATNEKKLFVSFLLEAIFNGAVQRGIQDDVVEIIVLDEAHLFLTEDQDNPINTIAKEARKYGLGLFAASQSPTHFSDDFLANVSTKIILGIDEMFWKGSVSKLRMDMKDLEWIVAHKKILMQMSQKGQTKNEFIHVSLEDM